jgi:hypothetical protein
MYNKYFTMKKSELKEAIKNEITSVLSEQSDNPAFDKKIANFAKKINNEMGYPGGVLEAMKQIKSRLERIISKVEGAKRGGAEEEPLMKMIGLSEEKEEDDDDKAASKSAKKEKLGKQASKLSQADEDRYERIKNGLEKLKKKGDEESIKKMKAILGKKEVEELIKAKGRTKASFM